MPTSPNCIDCGKPHKRGLFALRCSGSPRATAIATYLPRLSGAITCVDCLSMPAVCYDHRDYRKPLEVDPVCQGCNVRRGPAIESAGAVTRYELRADVFGPAPEAEAA